MGNIVTIKSIAEIMKISPATVSRALNNKPGLSKDLREQIKNKAREMQYYPNARAQALVKGRIGIIGVIIPRPAQFVFSTPLYTKILMGIGSEVKKRNNHILLFFANKDENGYASMYQQGQVDGVIVVANRLNDKNITKLEENNVPTVLIPGYMNEGISSFPNVRENNEQGVFKATEHLIHLGHKKITFIIGSYQSKYTLERLEGYKMAMAKHSLSISDHDILISDFTEQSGFKLMMERMSRKEQPTAVIGINDNVTIGAIHAIHRLKRKIPDDISVIAVGGTEYVQNFTPKLTILKIPMVEIGKMAAKMLMKVLDGIKIRKKTIILETEFIINESTGKAPQ